MSRIGNGIANGWPGGTFHFKNYKSENPFITAFKDKLIMPNFARDEEKNKEGQPVAYIYKKDSRILDSRYVL